MIFLGESVAGGPGGPTQDPDTTSAHRIADRLGSALASEDFLGAARLGGPALAIAAFAASADDLQGRAWDLPEPAWALSVGGAVRRGLPTAARGTLTARTRLRAGVVEAQFGGEFAAFFAERLDALFVYGRADVPVVLECFAGGDKAAGDVNSTPLPPGFGALGLSARKEALRGIFGSGAAMLVVGPGADMGLPIANVASISPGPAQSERGVPDGGASRAVESAAPSFVGRGGLGLALRDSGVVAVIVHPPAASMQASSRAGSIGLGSIDAESKGAEAEALRRRLLASPRLLARDVGGTLELGALREPEGGEVAAAGLPSTGSATKHGCRGCPTPCGWTFDQPATESGGGGFARTGGRFAALQGAAGEADGGLGFLGECNELGLDARSCALVMNRLRAAGGRFDGPRDFVEPGSPAFRLAISLDAGSDVEPAASAHRADLSAQVGAHLSARGPEPVRSLSVLAFGSVEPKHVIAPLPWTGDADWDAGVLAYWHGCFAAAIDVSGFCAFSAAGLLADGVMELDELALLLAPEGGWAAGTGVGPGLAMLRAGAGHVHWHRALHRVLHQDLLGDPAPFPGPPATTTEAAWARAIEGYLDAQMRGALMGESPPVVPTGPLGGTVGPKASRDGKPGPEGMESGAVRLRVSGLLAARLGPPPGGSQNSGSFHLDCDLPAPGADLAALLGALALAHPAAAPWLLGPDGGVIPAAIAGGRRLDPGAALIPGAEIELILAIPGG